LLIFNNIIKQSYSKNKIKNCVSPKFWARSDTAEHQNFSKEFTQVIFSKKELIEEIRPKLFKNLILRTILFHICCFCNFKWFFD